MSDAPQAAAPKPRRWRRWLLEILLLIIIAVGVFAWKARHLLPSDGQPAPAATLRTLDGAPVSLADYRGKRVTLHFWATWCSTCSYEHGTLNAVHAELGDDEALLSIVADGEDVEKVRRHVAEAGIKYPVLLTDRATLEAFKITQFPTNYYLDSNGQIANSDVGISSRWGVRWRLGRAGGE